MRSDIFEVMNNCNKTKVIFFDMGNTLLHFHEGPSDDEKDLVGLEHLRDHLFDRYKIQVDIDDLKTGFLDEWYQCLPKRKKYLEEYPVEDYLNQYLEKFSIRLNLRECISALKEFHREYQRYVQYEKGLENTLGEIKKKGVKIGVISNCYLYDEIMIDHFNSCGIGRYIDYYTFSYYIKKRKPRKEIFEQALNIAEIEASSAIMIGDLLEADILGAKRVGMKAIWLNNNHSVNQTNIAADYEIKKLSDILDFVFL